MNFELRLKSVENEIDKIKNRNSRVETDKAWETSALRTFVICFATYLTTSFIFYIIKVDKFYFTSIIPTVGFFLSVQSLPIIKNWWIKNRYYK